MGELYVVRHGQATALDEDYDNLTDRGHDQARAVGAALAGRGVRPDLVIRGAMLRHAQTAVAAMEAAGWTGAEEVDARWDELDHVELIGVHAPHLRSPAVMVRELARQPDPRQAFSRLFRDALDAWVSGDGDYSETYDQFRMRVGDVVSDLARRVGQDGTAVVFTSGGPMAMMATSVLGLDARGWQQLLVTVNGGISRYSTAATGVGVALTSYNEHAHLQTAGLLTRR